MRSRRDGRRLWLPLLVMVVVLVAGAVTMRIVTADPGPDCRGDAAKGRIGASQGSDLLTMSDDDLNTLLDRAKDAGVWSMRVDVDWSSIESVQGQRDWSDVDRVVDAVVDRGMCPHALIGYAPDWAAEHPDAIDGYFAPKDPEAFGGFVADAADRYRSSVSVWEIWNEPNTINYFRPAPSPPRYALLLAAAYKAVKAADPDATVVSGGLAPAENNGMDIPPLQYLEALYKLGANAYLDAFGIHPYTYPALPDDTSTSEWNTAQHMWEMRDVMVDGGDSAKPIWITECGAPTGTATRAVTDAVQADTLRIVFTAARDTDWLGPAFFYSVRDSGSDASESEQNFGVLRRDFSPKPAYDTVRTFGGEQ